MVKYNEKKMSELLQQKGVTRAEFRRGMNNPDDRIVKKWLAGGDLPVSKLLAVAEWFEVDVRDFFWEDGVVPVGKPSGASVDVAHEERKLLAVPMVTATAEALLQSERKEHEKELRHLQEQMDLRICYERKLAALERENEMLREELAKRKGCADYHSAMYVEHVETCADKAAEDEQRQ